MAITKKAVAPQATFHQKYFWWLVGFGVILMIILLYTIFSRKPSVDTKKYDELQQVYNTILQQSAEKRAEYEANRFNDSIEIEKYKNESNYYLQLSHKNAEFYQRQWQKFRDAPVTVPRISNKYSLRAAGQIIR